MKKNIVEKYFVNLPFFNSLPPRMSWRETSKAVDIASTTIKIYKCKTPIVKSVQLCDRLFFLLLIHQIHVKIVKFQTLICWIFDQLCASSVLEVICLEKGDSSCARPPATCGLFCKEMICVSTWAGLCLWTSIQLLFLSVSKESLISITYHPNLPPVRQGSFGNTGRL